MSSNPAPSVDDIPYASQLQTQLTLLNQAIDCLNNSGVINFLTASPPPPPPSVGGSGSSFPVQAPQPIRVSLDPPISDPATVANVAAALQKQADAITAQLATMGYAPSSKAHAARSSA